MEMDPQTETSLLPAPIASQMAGHLIPAVEPTRRKSASEAAMEFFSAKISNENTRESYKRDATQFASKSSRFPDPPTRPPPSLL